MTIPDRSEPSGYVFERVYASELTFVGHPESDDLKDGEPGVSFAWDWEILDDTSFRVLLSVSQEACRERPETVGVTVNGVFRCEGDVRSLPLLDFVRYNAPALLMPFAREAIASLTGRGLLGAAWLPPLNMVAIMNDYDANETTGARQLLARPDLSERFGAQAAGPTAG